MSILTDNDLFPFGKYRDARMIDVPASYLEWAGGQEWIGKWPDVKKYIADNRAVINKELERSEEDWEDQKQNGASDYPY